MAWHLSRQAKELGKFTDDQLRRLAAAGKLLPSDMIWQSGMTQWIRVVDLPGLLPPSSFHATVSLTPPHPIDHTTAVASLSAPSAFDFATPSPRHAKSRLGQRKKKPRLVGVLIIGLVAVIMGIGLAGALAFRPIHHDPSKPLSAITAKQLVQRAKRTGDDFVIAPQCSALTTEAAEILSQFDGNLWLDDVRTLSADVAAKLAKHKGALSLDGLGTLSVAAAKQLAARRGELSLNGLKTMSPDVATALSGIAHKLTLDGISGLTPELAASLALFNADVWLDGVRDLGTEAARAFADGDGNGKLWVMELDRISANAQQTVQQHSARFAIGGKGSQDPVVYGAATRQQVAKVQADDKGPPLITGRHLKLQGENFEGKRVRVVGRIWWQGTVGASAPGKVLALRKDQFTHLRVTSSDISDEVHCYAARIDQWVELLLNYQDGQRVTIHGTVDKMFLIDGSPYTGWGVVVDHMTSAN